MTKSPPQLSGKFVIRLPLQLHKTLKINADRLKISLNNHCISLLSSDTQLLQDRENSLIKIIQETFGTLLHGIVLFGSQARGESTNSSDIDLLICLKSGSKITRELYRLWDSKVTDNIDSNINPHFVALPLDANSCGGLWLEIAMEGIIMWEKDFAISRFLNKLKLVILNSKVQSNMSHGHRYWQKA